LIKENFDKLVDHFVTGGFFLVEAVELLEKSMIARALEKTNGNRLAASKLLGIHRNTLQRKTEQYQIEGRKTKAARKPAQRVKAAVAHSRKSG
jgi:DNA-binding NtrC family response regulator